MQLQAIKKEIWQHIECHLFPCQHQETTQASEDRNFRSRQLGSKRGIGSSWAEVRSHLVLTALFNTISQHQTSDCKHGELAKYNCTDHKCILRDCPSTLAAQRAQGNAHRAASSVLWQGSLSPLCTIFSKIIKKSLQSRLVLHTDTAGYNHCLMQLWIITCVHSLRVQKKMLVYIKLFL